MQTSHSLTGTQNNEQRLEFAIHIKSLCWHTLIIRGGYPVYIAIRTQTLQSRQIIISIRVTLCLPLEHAMQQEYPISNIWKIFALRTLCRSLAFCITWISLPTVMIYTLISRHYDWPEQKCANSMLIITKVIRCCSCICYYSLTYLWRISMQGSYSYSQYKQYKVLIIIHIISNIYIYIYVSVISHIHEIHQGTLLPTRIDFNPCIE